jgi:hypothetical protein
MPCVLVLLSAIDVAVVLVGLVRTPSSCPFGGASTPRVISKGDEVASKVTESVTT